MLKPELPSRTFISDHRLSSAVDSLHDCRGPKICVRKHPVKSMRIAHPNHGTNFDSPNGPVTPVCFCAPYTYLSIYLFTCIQL